uniref:Uncharacterized protein n=1 Tax=Anguilla anguilla TaxID=7936 RepID=A0A0E9UZH3_ANGAN
MNCMEVYGSGTLAAELYGSGTPGLILTGTALTESLLNPCNPPLRI